MAVPLPAEPVTTSGLSGAELELERRVSLHPTFNKHPYSEFEHLRRFLAARNRNVDDAYAMWEKWATWHSSYQPEHITEEEVQGMLATRKVTVWGRDKGGRGVVYVKLAQHEPSPEETARTVRAAVYCIEQAIKISKANGGDGFITVFWDHQGCGWKNFDSGLLTGPGGVIRVLQEYYPERLFAVHILHADWVFWALWKVVSPFLDDRTRHKVMLVRAPPELRSAFDADQLQPMYRDQVYANAKDPVATQSVPPEVPQVA